MSVKSKKKQLEDVMTTLDEMENNKKVETRKRKRKKRNNYWVRAELKR